MRRLTVDMQALIDAMTMPADVPFTWFFDVRDGSIIEVDREDEEEDEDDFAADPEGCIEIPQLQSREQYDIMTAFAAAVDDDELREMLGDALHGKGAFSRFRRVVDRYPELRDSWFAFRREALMEEARRWLALFDIEPLYEPRSEQPRPVTQVSAPPKIGLLDLVLLGAPDGKTELLEGRVLRQIHARTPSEARSIFERVARELCWFFDQPWRKRYVEGRSGFDLERAHLVIDGDVVQLWVDVPMATWSAFR